MDVVGATNIFLIVYKVHSIGGKLVAGRANSLWQTRESHCTHELIAAMKACTIPA